MYGTNGTVVIMHRKGYVMVKALVPSPLWTVTIIDFCIIIIFKYIKIL